MGFIAKLKQYSKTIYLSVLFLAASAIAVLSFPLQGKFKYEYKKGTPWQHETLIAPFNFPIYKTEVEIKTERDSVLKNFVPYFQYDKMVESNYLAQYLREFDARYAESVSVVQEKYPGRHINDTLKAYVKNKGSVILHIIYEKGVAEHGELVESVGDKNAVVIVDDNIVHRRSVDEIFTQKIAYTYIRKYLNKRYADQPWLRDLIENLKLYDYVDDNITFDASLTDKQKQELLEQISGTEGMVQSGELIISLGEVVNNDDFKVLESLRKEYESFLGTSKSTKWLFVGQILLVLISFGLLYLFLHNFRREILDSYLKSLFILLMVVIMVIATSLTIAFGTINLYIVPFVALPIIIQAFYDARLAFFIHLVTVVLCGFYAPNGFEFVFLNVVAGAVAVFSLAQIYKRGQLFIAIAWIFLAYSLSYTALALMQEGTLSEINTQNYIWFAINGGLLLAVYPLIFVFEKLFGFLSEVTLMELSDTNHPALRQLAEKAPGTFQHVMQVANLAEEVGRKIGANPLLIRVGALYHDIGKTGAPSFFIENQSGKSPHDDLPYDKSAEMIIQHVYHGMELAKKYKLPQPIVDFIVTHHGTGIVKYFYTKYANEHEGKVPDISKFSYPGPSPFTKETAVLMMADAVEAASRTLKEYNEDSIGALVNRIVDGQIEDNQFADAEITYKEVTIAKAVFVEKLMNIYHARIEYPDLKQPVK